MKVLHTGSMVPDEYTVWVDEIKIENVGRIQQVFGPFNMLIG